MDEVMLVRVNRNNGGKLDDDAYLKEVEDKIKGLGLKCKTLVTFDDVDIYTIGGGFTATACSCDEKEEETVE